MEEEGADENLKAGGGGAGGSQASWRMLASQFSFCDQNVEFGSPKTAAGEGSCCRQIISESAFSYNVNLNFLFCVSFCSLNSRGSLYAFQGKHPNVYLFVHLVI